MKISGTHTLFIFNYSLLIIMTAILIDDEQTNNDNLAAMLQMVDSTISIVATANNIDDAYIAITTHQPNIIFLDVEMPFGNGFMLLNKFSTINFAVIFVTAYNQYAAQAFRYAAIDYLLKPVFANDLAEALTKATTNLGQQQQQIKLLLQNDKAPYQKLALLTNVGIRSVCQTEIAYIMADKNNAIIYLKTKEAVRSTKNLKHYEGLVDIKTFCRIHDSVVANTDYIKKIDTENLQVTLINDTILQLARRRKADLLAYFKK